MSGPDFRLDVAPGEPDPLAPSIDAQAFDPAPFYPVGQPLSSSERLANRWLRGELRRAEARGWDRRRWLVSVSARLRRRVESGRMRWGEWAHKWSAIGRYLFPGHRCDSCKPWTYVSRLPDRLQLPCSRCGSATRLHARWLSARANDQREVAERPRVSGGL